MFQQKMAQIQTAYICPMFDSINQYISRCIYVSPEELEYFNAVLEYRQIPKKTILLHEGETCNFEAYIIKGCIRTYYIDDKGIEVTLQFAIEDWWVSDIASFHDQKPSSMFIETLEDCDLLTLNPQTKETLLAKIPRLERVFRLMVQRNLSALQDRLFKTIASSATDKYLDFIKHYPGIPQRVTQHYIASYLGISPEFLSKIRKRLAKK